MKYLELAIEQDPENASFHFAKGFALRQNWRYRKKRLKHIKVQSN